MSTAEKKLRYTFEEYLALEEKADYRSEFFNGEIFAMSGGSSSHSRIIFNTNREIGNAIYDSECSGFEGNLKVRIEESNVSVYPDLMVVCGPEKYYQDNPNLITNPTVIVEVLSESTALYDRTGKFRHYKRLPSFKEYVLIEQKEPRIDVYHKNKKGEWVWDEYEGIDAIIELKSIAISLSAKRVYHRVQFPEQSSK